MYRQFVDLAMLDITTTPMEVAPTAHYSMGGVRVDAETHATDVEGLYAVGECATGVHGANRLGGNSLAECLVFGRIVGARGRALVGGPRRAGPRPRARSTRRARRSTSCSPAAATSSRGRSSGRCATSCPSAAASSAPRTACARDWRASPSSRARTGEIEVRPDIAGYADLAHAFDLQGSLLAARATLESRARASRDARRAQPRRTSRDAGPAPAGEPRLDARRHGCRLSPSRRLRRRRRARGRAARAETAGRLLE